MNDDLKLFIMTIKIQSDLRAWLEKEADKRRTSMAYILRSLIVEAMEKSMEKEYVEKRNPAQGL